MLFRESFDEAGWPSGRGGVGVGVGSIGTDAWFMALSEYQPNIRL